MQTLQGAIPAQAFEPPENEQAPSTVQIEATNEQVGRYVQGWRGKLRTQRLDKVGLWDECWRMYRGLEDWKDKDDWQAKIFLPKSWASVEQATNLVARLLATNPKPWLIEPYNEDDLVLQFRASQVTDLAQTFLTKASYIDAFKEALKVSFIMGLGVMKVWWGFQERERVQVEDSYTQDEQGNLLPTKNTVWEKYREGQLFVRAVDPYRFYWLPGSKLNEWVGTLEEFEVPKWELMEMALQGGFDEEVIRNLTPVRTNEAEVKELSRFGGRQSVAGADASTGMIKLTEYYGPIIVDDVLVEKHGYVLMANDQTVLRWGKNAYWNRKPPYIAFSPLTVPFRTEGVGLVEMVREVNKALNKIANMSVDSLVYRLLPVFEVTPEVYENAEDFETGLTPGKIFRRSQSYSSDIGIRPLPFEDVSAGTIQVAAQLDRAHQEGSLVSEIQQALPRFRGLQTATELELKQANQDSFFGGLANEIESKAIKPLVSQTIDLLMQFLSSSQDPRVASILGVGANSLASMSRDELLEMIQGEYMVKVSGITEQLEKAEMLNNLVQFMNIIGQNGEMWGPYINQDALLRRIMEAFRPTIRDIDGIIADPATIEARKAAIIGKEQMQQMMQQLPQMAQLEQAGQQADFDASMQIQQMEMQKQEMQLQQMQQMQQALQQAQQEKK